MPTFDKKSKVYRLTYSQVGTECKKEDLLAHLEKVLSEVDFQYVIGLEEHKKTGGWHLHAHLQFSTAFRCTRSDFFDFGGHHPSIKGSFGPRYAAKDGDFITNRTDMADYRPVVKFTRDDLRHEWQRSLYDKFATPPDRFCRDVHWIWSEKGGVGKSTFANVLVDNYRALLVSGKMSDMTYAVACMKEKTGMGPDIVIVNVPRSAEGHFSYAGIEAILDGRFFASKYESQMVAINKPHVVVLTNFPYPEGKMSSDRYIEMNVDVGV